MKSRKNRSRRLVTAQQNGLDRASRDPENRIRSSLEVKNAELSARKSPKSVREAVSKIGQREEGLDAGLYGADQVLYAQMDITEDVLKAVK